MEMKKGALEKIVGKGNVYDDEETLSTYACDQSFVQSRYPTMVVFVETVEQIQAIVRLANKTLTPLIPYSSGKNNHGATIADQGGVIINMSRMKKIIIIDEENWFAVIEPGVTYQQLQHILLERGFWMMMPFGVHPSRSVLTSYVERDPVLASPSFECGNALILDTEVVLPEGDIFKTGGWASGGRPGLPTGPIRTVLYRLWTGAQGTLGIVTKMGLQIEPLPPSRKLFFIPLKSLQDALELVVRIQRREIGMECFLLNNFNLAAIFTENWDIPENIPAEAVFSDEFEKTRQKLPSWTLIICLHALPRYPEEKIAYEEEALHQLCELYNRKLLDSLDGIASSNKLMLAEMLRPWRILRKYHYKGSVHDLSFKAPVDAITKLEHLLCEMAIDCGYPPRDIGMYLLPLERGRAMHVEFDLHSNPCNQQETEIVRRLWYSASSAFMTNEAYFDRPYGPWAPMVYGRATEYAMKLRQIKKELDPNNIMNPGKLCFR